MDLMRIAIVLNAFHVRSIDVIITTIETNV
ncbi:hypothetical protein [Escherichia phage PH1062]|nr:hypothetical protein [Escherichia phage PH1062]